MIEKACLILSFALFVSVYSAFAMQDEGASSVINFLPEGPLENESYQRCPICLNSIVPGEDYIAAGKDVFNCSVDHVCHVECLRAWLEGPAVKEHIGTCPLCKKISINERLLVMQAVDDGDLRKVWSFIERGGNVDERDDVERTLLMRAVCAEKFNIVKCMCDCNAQVDAPDKRGATPLMLGVHQRHYDIINYLLVCSADVNARDFRGHSVLMYSPIGDVTMIDFLLAQGANINMCDNTGATLLMLAAKQGERRVVRFLLSRKADVRAHDVRGWTAVDYARCNRHEKIARRLAALFYKIKD